MARRRGVWILALAACAGAAPGSAAAQAKAHKEEALVASVRRAVQAQVAAAKKDIARLDEVIATDERNTWACQRRGEAHFRAGEMAASIRDFDVVIKRRPDRDPHHWQRGIAYYYAGRFREGAAQFERHRAVNPNDVENAAWHFLCVARAEGFETARKKLIHIPTDGRVPMMTIFRLFAGKASVQDVLDRAEKGRASDALRAQQRFYAHLYVGLYHEIAGEPAKARRHILRAAAVPANHYMGNVARVHAKILLAAEEEKKKKKEAGTAAKEPR